MRYLRIFAEDDGASRFEDVELDGTMTYIVDGVPPLLLSGPFECSEITFVKQPKDTVDWEAHVAPRKQGIIVLSGRVAFTTTDGKCREVGPGEVILVEDTAGRGHLSTPLDVDFRFAMISSA